MKDQDEGMRSYFFALILAIQLLACSKSVDHSKTANFLDADIQSAEAIFCGHGLKLKEADVSGAFEDMGEGVKVFGFSSGEGSCALDRDVHYNNLGLTWFDLVDVNGCIPQWKPLGSHRQSHGNTQSLF